MLSKISKRIIVVVLILITIMLIPIAIWIFRDKSNGNSADLSLKFNIVRKINEIIDEIGKSDRMPFIIPENKKNMFVEWLKKINFYVKNTPENDAYENMINAINDIENELQTANAIGSIELGLLENIIGLLLGVAISKFEFLKDEKFDCNDLHLNKRKEPNFATEDDKCGICWDILKDFPVCITGCGHILHKKCFIRAIEIGNVDKERCPICRSSFYEPVINKVQNKDKNTL